MNGTKNQTNAKRIATISVVGAILQWISQPPFCLWIIAFVALVPWLMLVAQAHPLGRRGYLTIWGCAFLYWLISLQGLRHAHWAIYPAWIALAAYLSVYVVLFVSLCRRMLEHGILGRSVPLWVAAPVAWVGLECVRNYFMTGLSAAMLGHTMADVPWMIQIADMFGTYGVSFVLVTVNVAIFSAAKFLQEKQVPQKTVAAILLAVLLMAATLGYGVYRVKQTSAVSPEPAQSPPLATFALVQRSEVVEYVDDAKRSYDMFTAYENQTLAALRSAGTGVDAVLWPESMMTAGSPWFFAAPDAVPPKAYDIDAQEFQLGIAETQQRFTRAREPIQAGFARVNPSGKSPHLLGGCSVVGYADVPNQYNGFIHLGPDASMRDWYGKTHLVLVGEYVPVLGSIPAIRTLLPLLTPGDGPKRFVVGDTTVSPNICIETAVERVTVNQMGLLNAKEQLPDVIATITNDGWFDESSVIEHHLRCAQLVAVGIRRPILSAGNNGPTAWIDSLGRVVKRLETGTNGSIIATPRRDSRTSLYIRIGDWPARLLAIACIVFLFGSICDWRNQRRESRKEKSPDDARP